MRPTPFATASLTITAITLTGLLAGASAPTATATGSTTQAAAGARAERGRYLVGAMGCNDCHTPFKMGPTGPEPDMSRALTGHPAGLTMPPAPELPPGPWVWVGAGTNTAFAGPWGVSFTANLTPDKETGLGDWTEQQFMQALRTGRHQGKGRPILPPMPYRMIGTLSDEDLKGVFAYLQSLAPVHNRVPAPVDPAEGAK